MQNINLGELPIFVVHKYCSTQEYQYFIHGFHFISHSDLKQQGRYPQSLKVPATTSASGEFDRKLSKAISSKYLLLQIIQSSNFFKIFVPPKYDYIHYQISSKYMFFRIILSPNIFQIYVPPKSLNHQISSNYTFLQIIKLIKKNSKDMCLQNHSIIKFLPNIWSSKIISMTSD